MKIAINTRLLLKNRMDGIGWFTWETVRRMADQHPEHEFHFLFDRTPDPSFLPMPRIIPHVLFPPARHSILMKIWYDYAVPRALRRIGADLFLSPDSQCSLTTDIPQLVVIHDINFVHYPQDLPPQYARLLGKRTPLFANKARRIATVSEFSRSDLVKTYGIDSEKIDVVYNGSSTQFKPLDDQQKKKTRGQWTGGEEYFVFVGSIHPRKNLQRLLPAFDQFRERTGSQMKLVVAGNRFWYNETIRGAYESMKHRDAVVFTGHLSAEDLAEVVAASLALVYVSYFEGFGIPILEAFACGVPVITSNCTSMPEVAGEAALFVDPFSVDSITNALVRIAKEPDLRESLIIQGHQRSTAFSWDRTASLLWSSVEKCL